MRAVRVRRDVGSVGLVACAGYLDGPPGLIVDVRGPRGFDERLGGDQLPFEHRLQVFFLLLIGAEMQDQFRSEIGNQQAGADGAVAARQSPPTLRLYAWHPPAMTLGRGQSFTDADLAALQADGVMLLRRATGGTAVFHADELTYSVAAPDAETLSRAGPQDIVLIAGKGHETVQIVGDKSLPFSDRERVMALQREWSG